MKFAGFPDGPLKFTPIPDLFFSELLGQIDDVAELKVTLYCFWRLHAQRRRHRYVSEEELHQDGLLLQALKQPGRNPQHVLREALEQAVRRGTLLRLDVEVDGADQTWYFLNTEHGRRSVADIRDGALAPQTVARPVAPRAVPAERPSIFDLYEQNVGLLQPLIAEELREAAATYPEVWIEEAFRIAAERNVRNWRYVRAILERWAREGRGNETHSRHTPPDRAAQTRRHFLEELD